MIIKSCGQNIGRVAPSIVTRLIDVYYVRTVRGIQFGHYIAWDIQEHSGKKSKSRK